MCLIDGLQTDALADEISTHLDKRHKFKVREGYGITAFVWLARMEHSRINVITSIWLTSSGEAGPESARPARRCLDLGFHSRSWSCPVDDGYLNLRAPLLVTKDFEALMPADHVPGSIIPDVGLNTAELLYASAKLLVFGVVQLQVNARFAGSCIDLL